MARSPKKKHFDMRCDEHWHAAAQAAAAAEGKSLSEYVRRATASCIDGGPAVGRLDREAALEATRQLRSAGRNLNRLLVLLEIFRARPAPLPPALAGQPKAALERVAWAVEEAAAELKRRVESW